MGNAPTVPPEPSGDVSRDLTAPPDKLSAFIARILDQLSLSAWLPAAFLAAALAVLYQLRSQRDLDVAAATKDLVSDPITILIVTVPVVVLTTLVTQSFSFEAIRALEGYWNRRWLLGWLHVALTRLRLVHKRRMAARLLELRDKAFASARGPMLRIGIPTTVIAAVEADLNEKGREDLSPHEELQRAALSWREFGDPVAIARYDRMLLAHDEYPEDGLVMPTKLGNVLRSTESRLQNAGGDVSNFGLRRRRLVDARIQQHHDQFRTRLDMYCTLVFVAVFLAIASPIILIPVPHERWIGAIQWLLPSALFLALSWASYRAAIASARGYCAILRVMDDAPTT